MTDLTPHAQLVRLKAVLPAEVWPKEIHDGDMNNRWCYTKTRDPFVIPLEDQHALDIVTAAAERWLKGEGWFHNYDWGRYSRVEIGRITLIEAIEWQVKQ